MDNRGEFKTFDEIENNTSIHRARIVQLEQITKRAVVWCHAPFSHPGSAMSTADKPFVENCLRSIDLERFSRKVDLVLTTPGGALEGTVAILQAGRSYASHLRVVVSEGKI